MHAQSKPGANLPATSADCPWEQGALCVRQHGCLHGVTAGHTPGLGPPPGGSPIPCVMETVAELKGRECGTEGLHRRGPPPTVPRMPALLP